MNKRLKSLIEDRKRKKSRTTRASQGVEVFEGFTR